MPHTNTTRNRFSVNDPYIQVWRAEATASAASRARPSVADLGRPRVCRLAAMSADDLPVAEFAFPGPLRDQLVAAILAGEKTTTTGLVADHEHENEPLPVPGLREVVVDSAGRPVAVIETTAVRVMRLADVDLNHALGEGEGFSSVAEWRAGHAQFWHSAEMRQALGDPAFKVGDDTLVVASEFRLIQE
jgi:uncharacterized protein YhfF